MNKLEEIRKLPQEEKIKIIKRIAVITAILLIILWVFTSRIGNSGPKDTTLFETIGKTFSDFKNQVKK